MTTPATPQPADQATEVERLRTENERMRHELEVMYGGAFDSLDRAPADRAAILREAADRIDDTREPFPIAIQNGITWATAELRRMAVEAEAATEARPRRGDAVEQWLKAQRDQYETRSSREWRALDEVLDTYRLHADTGTPLSEHVCEARTVGDCDCLETPPTAPSA